MIYYIFCLKVKEDFNNNIMVFIIYSKVGFS